MVVTESRGCWVYIAELGDGRLYVGVTNNPDRRAGEHQLGTSIRTTRIFGFRKILYFEPHPDLASARKREQQLKGWTRAKKLALANGDLEALKRLARSKGSKA
jgi:putative endonuclease